MTPFDARQRARECLEEIGYSAASLEDGTFEEVIEIVAALLTAVRDEALEEAHQDGVDAVTKFLTSYSEGRFAGNAVQQKQSCDDMHHGAIKVLEAIRTLKSKGEGK